MAVGLPSRWFWIVQIKMSIGRKHWNDRRLATGSDQLPPDIPLFYAPSILCWGIFFSFYARTRTKHQVCVSFVAIFPIARTIVLPFFLASPSPVGHCAMRRFLSAVFHILKSIDNLSIDSCWQVHKLLLFIDRSIYNQGSISCHSFIVHRIGRWMRMKQHCPSAVVICLLPLWVWI